MGILRYGDFSAKNITHLTRRIFYFYAKINYNLSDLIVFAFSFSRLRRQLPPGGSLERVKAAYYTLRIKKTMFHCDKKSGSMNNRLPPGGSSRRSRVRENALLTIKINYNLRNFFASPLGVILSEARSAKSNGVAAPQAGSRGKTTKIRRRDPARLCLALLRSSTPLTLRSG